MRLSPALLQFSPQTDTFQHPAVPGVTTLRFPDSNPTSYGPLCPRYDPNIGGGGTTTPLRQSHRCRVDV